MGRLESLRILKDSLEPDPNVKLTDLGGGQYKIQFDRGDTSKLPGRAWARVVDSVDPEKKGGYALQGRRWLHSGNKVKNGEIIAYNVAGSGKYGNMEDLFVSAIVDGEAFVLSECNWSDRDEKQSMIEDLADIIESLETGDVKKEGSKDESVEETVKAVSEKIKSEVQGSGSGSEVISDFLIYRTIGRVEDGCVSVRSDILKMLDLNEGDFVIVTIEIPPK